MKFQLHIKLYILYLSDITLFDISSDDLYRYEDYDDKFKNVFPLFKPCIYINPDLSRRRHISYTPFKSYSAFYNCNGNISCDCEKQYYYRHNYVSCNNPRCTTNKLARYKITTCLSIQYDGKNKPDFIVVYNNSYNDKFCKNKPTSYSFTVIYLSNWQWNEIRIINKEAPMIFSGWKK